MHYSTHPMHYNTHPVQNSTHPMQNSTHPMQNSTHPMQNSTHPMQYCALSQCPQHSLIMLQGTHSKKHRPSTLNTKP